MHLESSFFKRRQRQLTILLGVAFVGVFVCEMINMSHKKNSGSTTLSSNLYCNVINRVLHMVIRASAAAVIVN
jgi:heme/copper-type cytochrome/quinol oxidase subunit 3